MSDDEYTHAELSGNLCKEVILIKTKAFYSFGILFLLLVSSTGFAEKIDLNFNDHYWINPVGGNMQTDSAYDYMSSTYENSFNAQHLGVDIISILDDPVYAIADGRVTYIYRHDDLKQNQSVVFIHHETSERIAFTAVYGHCKARPSLSKGDRVVSGEKIGVVKRFNSPDHLHFGINETKNLSASNWGRLPVGSNVSEIGWRNPVDFLSQNQPIFYQWDGCGSIISYETGNICCYGCNGDVAMVHAGSHKKSKVNFQWQTSNTCKALKISTDTSDPLANEVNIRAGLWHQRNYDTIYSNVTLPFILDSNNIMSPFKQRYYFTVSIGFDNILDSDMLVSAQCTGAEGTAAENTIQYTKVNFDGLIQTNQRISQWMGNGSIISQECPNRDAWGCNRDEARIHPVSNGIHPEVYFQWQASEHCRSLRISSGPDQKNQTGTPNVEIFVKPWERSTSACSQPGQENCGTIRTRLPYTISDKYAPTDGSYSVIRVKFLDGIQKTQSVIAQCPGGW
jgi:murein DD-endopeptidase MepM/ murein hydrolase activator NlpD